jgi:hypothetical protein
VTLSDCRAAAAKVLNSCCCWAAAAGLAAADGPSRPSKALERSAFKIATTCDTIEHHYGTELVAHTLGSTASLQQQQQQQQQQQRVNKAAAPLHSYPVPASLMGKIQLKSLCLRHAHPQLTDC